MNGCATKQNVSTLSCAFLRVDPGHGACLCGRPVSKDDDTVMDEILTFVGSPSNHEQYHISGPVTNKVHRQYMRRHSGGQNIHTSA